jgi:hypothetical protein
MNEFGVSLWPQHHFAWMGMLMIRQDENVPPTPTVDRSPVKHIMLDLQRSAL